MKKEKEKKKTRESVIRASKKYDAGFDKVMVRLPKGTFEDIRALGYDSMNRFAKEAVEYRLSHPELEDDMKHIHYIPDKKMEIAHEIDRDTDRGPAGSPVLPERKENDLISIPEE